MATKTKRRFRWKEFALDVRTMRRRTGLGLRETARSLRIHHATWCRAEQGKPIAVPDFIFICDWLSNDPTQYLTKRAFP